MIGENAELIILGVKNTKYSLKKVGRFPKISYTITLALTLLLNRRCLFKSK